MATPFTREDWNGMIARFNDLADRGCTDAVQLPEVPEKHRWSVTDIEDVRDALTAMCNDAPVFSASLRKWSQDIIDELNDAIDNCECEETCPNTDTKEVYCGTWQPVTIDIDDDCNDLNHQKEEAEANFEAAKSDYITAIDNLLAAAKKAGGLSAEAAAMILIHGDADADELAIIADEVETELDGEFVYYSGQEAWRALQEEFGSEPLYALGNRAYNCCWAERQGYYGTYPWVYSCSEAQGQLAAAQQAWSDCLHNGGHWYIVDSNGNLIGVVGPSYTGYTTDPGYVAALDAYEDAKSDYEDAKEAYDEIDATIAAEAATIEGSTEVQHFIENALVETPVADHLAQVLAGLSRIIARPFCRGLLRRNTWPISRKRMPTQQNWPMRKPISMPSKRTPTVF